MKKNAMAEKNAKTGTKLLNSARA